MSTVALPCFRLIGSLLLMVVCLGCGSSKDASNDRHRIAFVTNQIASFWNVAKVGCEDAAKDFDVDVEVIMPANATAVEQKRIVEDLITGGIDAIAISPIDAKNQVDDLNAWASQVKLITHDSDAPKSDRLIYIGMDNYRGGRMCGQLVKEAIPDGGNVMLFIGRLEQHNAIHRRQGVIDELLGRDEDRTRNDPDTVLRGDKYTVLGTLTDNGLEDVAKRKAEDAITRYPELDAMVGLFAYNPPQCLQALKQQGKLGQIKLIGFDEADDTLQGIKDGHIQGTIVQNPYQYGYTSVEVLSKLLRGDESVLEREFIDFPARSITKDNVDEFWDDLNSKTSRL